MVLCQLWMGGVSNYLLFHVKIRFLYSISVFFFVIKLRVYLILVRTIYDRKFYNECFS